jgi:phosphate acyltransferase
MASALLRMGRIKGVARPAIATPIPDPGRIEPCVLLDAGANSDCQPEWLVQFAQMGAVYSRDRYGVERPKVACCRSARSRPRATRWSRTPTS